MQTTGGSELLTEEEAYTAFDNAAQFFLEMTGEDFARQWDAGELEESENPAIMDVAILRPVGR